MRESRTNGPSLRQVGTSAPASNRRTELRVATELRAAVVSVDPVPDGANTRGAYLASDVDTVANVSRRGVCLYCERPPAVGTRLVLELSTPDEPQPIDLVGRARWTRVEYAHGDDGARARACVGVEILGGSPTALDRWDRALGMLAERASDSVATPVGLR